MAKNKARKNVAITAANIAATAKSYDCVNSKTTNTTEIGAPTTVAVTAAKPATGSKKAQ